MYEQEEKSPDMRNSGFAPDRGFANDRDWRRNLPEDLRNDPRIAEAESLESVVRGYADKAREADAIRSVVEKRFDELTAEELDQALSRLGRPDRPENYELKRPEMPEHFQWDGDMENRFRHMAHQAGLLPRQAQGLIDSYAEVMISRYSDYMGNLENLAEQATHALMEEWGGAYDDHCCRAGRAIREFGGDQLLQDLKQAGLLTPEGAVTSPALAKAFAAIGRSLSEDSMIGPRGRGGSFGMSTSAAREKWEHKQLDRNFQDALFDQHHPGHKAALSEKRRLFEAMYPGK